MRVAPLADTCPAVVTTGAKPTSRGNARTRSPFIRATRVRLPVVSLKGYSEGGLLEHVAGRLEDVDER